MKEKIPPMSTPVTFGAVPPAEAELLAATDELCAAGLRAADRKGAPLYLTDAATRYRAALEALGLPMPATPAIA